MNRAMAAAITALVFVAAIAALALAMAGWDWVVLVEGARDLLENRPLVVVLAITIAYVPLAALVAAGLAGDRAGGWNVLGWLMALPGLVAMFGFVADSAGLYEAAGCTFRRSSITCPDTLAGGALAATHSMTFTAIYSLPFSLGPVLFAIGFPPVLIVRWLVRLLRPAEGRP